MPTLSCSSSARKFGAYNNTKIRVAWLPGQGGGRRGKHCGGPPIDAKWVCGTTNFRGTRPRFPFILNKNGPPGKQTRSTRDQQQYGRSLALGYIGSALYRQKISWVRLY